MVSDNPGSTKQRELTGEEAALYDRQIRLWGLDAQRRLAASTVLLVGPIQSLLTQELAKNLVLSGIASLSFASIGGAVSARGNFLGATTSDVSRSLSEINPLVSIAWEDVVVGTEHDSGAMQELLEKRFSVVCVVDCCTDVEKEVAVACRNLGVPFFCGRALGPVGYFYVDLGAQFEFTVDVTDDLSRETAANSGCGTPISRSRTAVANYISYSDAIAAKWGNEPRRSDCGWHVACCIRQFEVEIGRLPGQDADTDAAKMASIYQRLQNEKEPSRVNTDLVDCAARTASCCLPPVSAVVGGMWSREAIKALSRKDEPLNNFFFFSVYSSEGCVERIGS